MRPRTDDEILEDLKDWPVRNIYVERGVRLIETLRQRVSELEKERDDWQEAFRLYVADYERVCAERDALMKLYESSEESVLVLKETRNRLAKERDEALRVTFDPAVLEQMNILTAERDALKQQRDELLAAAEAIEIDAEECLDFDECTAMFVPIDTYHKLIEAIASVKEKS